MHGLVGNSALFWAPDKVGVSHALLDLSSRLALGTPENARVSKPFRPVLGPLEGNCEAATYDFIPVLHVGVSPDCKRFVAFPPLFGPPRGLG